MRGGWQSHRKVRAVGPPTLVCGLERMVVFGCHITGHLSPLESGRLRLPVMGIP